MLLPPKKKRANETRELTRPIEAALNRLPGVTCRRNNVGTLRDLRGIPITYGLGLGSADIVGSVTFECFRQGDYQCPLARGLVTVNGATFTRLEVARAFTLECKRVGRQKRKLDQELWGRCVRTFGVFYATVRSVDEAVAAVGRCRAGLSE